jgi:hypothetical protein
MMHLNNSPRLLKVLRLTALTVAIVVGGKMLWHECQLDFGEMAR